MLRIEPKTAEPKREQRNGQPFDHQKILGSDTTGGKGAENQDGQYKAQDPLLAPAVQFETIHQE
jgi:hypothetical protein